MPPRTAGMRTGSRRARKVEPSPKRRCRLSPIVEHPEILPSRSTWRETGARRLWWSCRSSIPRRRSPNNGSGPPPDRGPAARVATCGRGSVSHANIPVVTRGFRQLTAVTSERRFSAYPTRTIIPVAHPVRPPSRVPHLPRRQSRRAQPNQRCLGVGSVGGSRWVSRASYSSPVTPPIASRTRSLRSSVRRSGRNRRSAFACFLGLRSP